jgi:hypothetical protein
MPGIERPPRASRAAPALPCMAEWSCDGWDAVLILRIAAIECVGVSMSCISDMPAIGLATAPALRRRQSPGAMSLQGL